MEERASIPPTLPLPNPSLSYWQSGDGAPGSLPKSLFRSSGNPLPVSVHTVIIGSGITGSTLAYHLLFPETSTSSTSPTSSPSSSPSSTSSPSSSPSSTSPSSASTSPSPPQSTLLLDARPFPTSGATSRNGGHTKPASYRSFSSNLHTLGRHAASRIARFENTCMRSVHRFAREQNIACDSWEGETVDIIYDEGQMRAAKEAVRQMREVMGEQDEVVGEYEIVEGEEEVRRRYLAEGALGAVRYVAGSVSGYKFSVGMLERAVERRGLDVRWGVGVTGLRRVKAGDEGKMSWEVCTKAGHVIHAERVVMATNGYTAKLWPALQGVIVPLRGHATAHRPGSGLPKEGLPRTYSFIYEDGYEYMVSRRPGSTGEGDIIIGGGLTIGAEQGLYEYGTTDDTAADPIIIDYLKETTTRYFGRNWGNDDPTGRIKQEWTGIMGYSADGFPFVGQVPGENGLYIAASFQGSGMVLCFDTARTLALLMNDEAESAKKMLPECFWITEERLKHTFTGRLHTKVPKDLKLKEQPDD